MAKAKRPLSPKIDPVSMADGPRAAEDWDAFLGEIEEMKLESKANGPRSPQEWDAYIGEIDAEDPERAAELRRRRTPPTREEWEADLRAFDESIAEMAREDPLLAEACRRRRPMGDYEEYLAECNRLERLMGDPKTTLTALSGLFLTRGHPDVSDQLRWLIRNHRWTLTALGELAGVDPGALSRFMNGTQSPTLETVDRIARVMKLRLISEAKGSALYEMIVEQDRRKKKGKKGKP